jgi:hypothetical protein
MILKERGIGKDVTGLTVAVDGEEGFDKFVVIVKFGGRGRALLGILDLSAEESVLLLENLTSKDEIGQLQPKRRGLEMHRIFGLET